MLNACRSLHSAAFLTGRMTWDAKHGCLLKDVCLRPALYSINDTSGLRIHTSSILQVQSWSVADHTWTRTHLSEAGTAWQGAEGGRTEHALPGNRQRKLMRSLPYHIPGNLRKCPQACL